VARFAFGTERGMVMLSPGSGWFRDFGCFLAYAPVAMLWLDTGYSQQIPSSSASPPRSFCRRPAWQRPNQDEPRG